MALQYATEESSIFKIGKSGKAGRISKRRFRSGNSRLSGKTPTRVKPVDMINGAPFHPRRIVAFAQRRRNAGHNRSADIADAALCGAMNVSAETGYNPKGAVQNLAQSFDASKYTDDYRANLMKIIRAKMKGKKIDVAEPEERESTQVVDLMARLQESLDMGKKAAAGRTSRGTTTRAKRASKRKTA